MERRRKQSTSTYALPFLMVDSTDHVTGKTGLTPTVTLSKNVASFAAASGAVTEIGSGWYKVAGNTTDSNTLGPLLLHATGTAADPTDSEFAVVTYDPFSPVADFQSGIATQTSVNTIDDFLDTEIAAIKAKVDFLPSVTAGAAGGVFIAGTNAATTITTALTANVTGNLSGSVGSVTGAVGSVTAGVTLAASAVQAIWDALTSALTTAGSIGKKLADWVIGTTQTGDSFARLGAPVGASISVDLAAVKADTAAILVDTGTTLDAALAVVDANVDSILVDTAEIGAAGAGLTALATQASVNTIDDFLDTEIAAIKAKTDALPTDPADQSLIIAATDAIASAVAGVQSDTDNIQTRLPAALVDGKMDSVGAGGATAQQVWEYGTRTLSSGGSGGATAQEVWEYTTRGLTVAGSLNEAERDAIGLACLKADADDVVGPLPPRCLKQGLAVLVNDTSALDGDNRQYVYDENGQSGGQVQLAFQAVASETAARIVSRRRL